MEELKWEELRPGYLLVEVDKHDKNKVYLRVPIERVEEDHLVVASNGLFPQHEGGRILSRAGFEQGIGFTSNLSEPQTNIIFRIEREPPPSDSL